MEHPKISVIVPIYRVEQYLRECVDSIIHQTYTNLEIILIDDGSPDACGAICDEYAEQDSRIKVIHKENGGVSSARNAGLDSATGDNIAFVDGDDWIEPEMFENLFEAMQGEKADLSVNVAFPNGCEHLTLTDGTTLWKDSFRRISKSGKRISVDGFYCNLYRRELLRSIRFPEDMKIGEDLYFWLLVCCKAEKCALCEMHGYHLRQRAGSAYGGKTLLQRTLGDYDTIQKILCLTEQYPEMLPYAVEHLIAVTFIYFNATAGKKNLREFLSARNYLLQYNRTIAANIKTYSWKYRFGLFLMKYFPHVLYLMTVYRMTRGKWKGVK